MWNRFSGKPNNSKDDLPSQSTWRNDDEQRQLTNCSGPIVSSNSNKKSSPGADDRDPRGFNPTSTSYSSTVQGQHPQPTSVSIASSATASGINNDEPYMAPDLVRNVGLADQMPRSSSSRSSRDQVQAREIRDKKRSKTERSDGHDQDVGRLQKMDKPNKKDKGLRRTEKGLDEELGSSRGPADFPDQVASSGFSQFPGQYDGAIPGSNSATHEHPAMSSHVPDQFPGQFPTQSSAPYRPPLAASEGGPGLAAEYYGDAGQSVAEQPGNRANTPSLIIGAEPHLQPALAVAAPPPEPSASGAVGAAASFFNGEFEVDGAASTHGQQESSTHVSGQIRPNSNYHSSSAPVVPTIGGTAIGVAAGYVIASQTSSHQQRPDLQSSIEGAPSEYSLIAAHRPPSEMQDSHYSITSQPSKPGKQSSQPSSNPMYAAGAAGAAGLAVATYEHGHHSSHQNISPTSQYPTTSMVQRRRNRGPLSALVDFFKDPEGVAQFEEYSQVIGVCRHCFAPGSSPRDAPRKHFYGRRRSNERHGSTRVDKDNRYYSSENEDRRKNKSWLATGLAGYGLAKVGESLSTEKDGSDNTSSVRNGRFSPNGRDRRARRRSRSKERIEGGNTGDGKSDRKGTRNDMTNGKEATIYSTRRHSRTSSRSKERKTGLTEAAVGAAVGKSVVASSSRRQSRSPRGTSVKSKHTSQAPSPERRHKTKRKRDRGFFSFGNGSSSSSSVDLAYTGSQRKQRSNKRSSNKTKDDIKAEAALMGLGAAAAVLALNDGRQSHRKKSVRELVGVKETKNHDGYGLAQAHRSKKSANLDDELWESAAEDDYESVNSDLAYGAPVRRDSQSSSSSKSSGINKWSWRWGSKKDRRASSPRRKSSDQGSFPAVASAAGADLTGAASTSPDHRQGSAMTSTSSLPLQHVYPVPTSDPSRFDAGPEGPTASSNRSAMSSRPEAVPLQHPRPIAPVSAAIYSSQTAYDHSYSAPTGVAAFSQNPYHRSPATSYARHSTHEASIPGNLPHSKQQEDDTARDFRNRRRDSSPARYRPDSISSSMAPRRRTYAKDDSSAVRFDLTQEQEEKDRHERRRKRKQDTKRREAEEQEQTEKDRRASNEESVEKRGSKTRLEKDLETSQKSWIGPATVGAVGAAIVSAAATEGSRFEETREERRERRRRERELEDEKDALIKSERRRRQRERDAQEIAIKEHGRLPDENPASSEYVEHQGRSLKRQDMSVWQEAASTKRNSSHENYGAFFTPLEFLNQSSDLAKTTSANADADIDLEQVPQIVTVEPTRIHDLSDSPSFSFADTDGKVDPSKPSLPWQVPKLRLVEPTPPSTRGSTPVLQPKDADEEGFEEPQKDCSPSKVKWADDQTREFTIIAPKENCDEFIEPSSKETYGTDLVEFSRDTHERDEPDDETQPHNDPTMKSSSASYGEDVEFAATLAASAEDAGFDPSIVINNPSYRRRDSPPGSNERSIPGAFDDENESQLKKKERKRKEKTSRLQSQNNGHNGRDDDGIVQDIIRQVEESDSRPSDQVPSENIKDERESTKKIDDAKPKSGPNESVFGEKFFETQEMANEALDPEYRDVYKSPTEDVCSIESIDNEAESSRKSRKESMRDGTGSDNSASTVGSPPTTDASKDPQPNPKERGKGKGSTWDWVLGRSTNNLPHEKGAKGVLKEAISENYEEPEKRNKMSMERDSSRDRDDDDDSKQRNSIGGTTPQVPDSFSQDLPVKGQRISLPSTFSDAGSAAKYLDHGVELEQVEEKHPGSFLEMRPEPPPPPDTWAESEEISTPLKTTNLPTSPRAESETKSRRFLDAEISRPIQTMAALPPSPTAILFHFRLPGRSSSTTRSLSQTPISSNKSLADAVPKQKARSRSTDSKSSAEIRPSWLVERYGSHQEPVRPSSRTTSRSSSVHDPEGRERGQNEGDYELNETKNEPNEVEPAPSISATSHSIQPDLLDSQQATPAASSFHDSATVLGSPSLQACRVSPPKVAVEESAQHSSSTLKSGILGAIPGGSSAVALNKSGENKDPLRRDLPQEENEDFERDLDDVIFDTMTYPSYGDNLDQEENLVVPRAKKGKKNKRKGGQSPQETPQPSFTGAAEAEPSTKAVDHQLLSPENMQQIQEQDAQDAVDSWNSSVLPSTKSKKGKGRALGERAPEENGPSPNTYESPRDTLETTALAEDQESDSLTREMSRKQVVDSMTAAASDANKDDNQTLQSATVVVQAPVEIQAEEDRSELKGKKGNEDHKGLPRDDLQQDDLPQASLRDMTLQSDDSSQDGLPQDDLQAKTLPPLQIAQENSLRDDLPEDSLRHNEISQLKVQHKIHPQGGTPQVGPLREDFSQLQEPQTLSLQDDPQSDSVPVLSSSSAPATAIIIDPVLEMGHASYLESHMARPAPQKLDRGDLTRAISPQLELSPRATPLPDGDDEHDLLEEPLGTPNLTSLDHSDDKEKEIAVEQPLGVLHIQDPSAITPRSQGQPQDLSPQAYQAEAGSCLAAPFMKESKEGEKAKQSFSVEGDETAEIQEKGGLLPSFITSTTPEGDWLNESNDKSAIKVLQGKSETVESANGGFTNSENGNVEKEAKQSFSSGNSKTTGMHEGQEILPPLSASAMLEDHEAMKLIDESAVDVSQPKIKSLKDGWTGFNDKKKSENEKKVKPNFASDDTTTTEIEGENEALSKVAASEGPEYSEALDLIGEPAMHVPNSGLDGEEPIDSIDELENQTPKPKMPEDECAPSDSKKTSKQGEKQGFKTLHLGPGAQETELQSEPQPDARDDMNDRLSSLATTRTSQEISAMLGLGEAEASVIEQSDKAFTSDSQADYYLQAPPEGQSFGYDEGDLRVLSEPETHEVKHAPGKAQNDERSPTLATSVASANAAQVVQVMLVGETNAESATDAKSESMAVSTGMKEETTDTLMRDDEMNWEAPKKKKKGKKGKKIEDFSWDKPETTHPAEVSGPPGATDNLFEPDFAVDKPIEDDELNRDAPKKKKKGKKGKKKEVFSLDEPEIVEPEEFSGPPAVDFPPSLEQEPAVTASDDVFSKQSKKDRKNKKGKRKGNSRAVSDFRDEDEPIVVPTEVPQDEDKAEDLSAIARDFQEENEPSVILNQVPQEDNKAEDLHANTRNSHNEVEPSVVPTEVLHNDNQSIDPPAVGYQSVTRDVREGIESDLVPTEAPPDNKSVEDLPTNIMPPIREIDAPGGMFKPAVLTESVEDDENEKPREISLEQEEYSVPSKGKMGKKRSKKSDNFSLNADENLTLGDGQIDGPKFVEKDEPEQKSPSSVNVVEQSEKTDPTMLTEQEQDFTLPAKRKNKKKPKKSSAFPPDKDILPALEDNPASKTEDLGEEPPRKTFSSNVGVVQDPGTNAENYPQEKNDRDETEESQPAEWKSEDVIAQSKPEPAQAPSKNPKTKSNVNTMKISGDLGMVEDEREQSMPEDLESTSVHVTTPEVSQKTTPLTTSSLEQPTGASEVTLAGHAYELNGNIVPAVETDVDSLFSLKPSKNDKKMAKKAKKARRLASEEDDIYQEPRVTLNEFSATDHAGEPSIIPASQHSQSWSKPEISAQEVESTEIVQPGVRSEEHQGHQGKVLEGSPSQARYEVQAMVEADQEASFAKVKGVKKGEMVKSEMQPMIDSEEDRSPANGKELAWETATSPIQGNEQISEGQPRDGMNTAGAIRSNQENPETGSKKEQDTVLTEPGATEKAKDHHSPRDLPVQVAEKSERKHDEAQRDESKIEDWSSSVAPRPAQEIVETVRRKDTVADVEPLGSLDKDKPIPPTEIERLDAEGQREYNEEYARELERAVPNAGPVAHLDPLGSPDIDTDKSISAVEVDMLNAQEQRDYNEEYAKELERQLGPLQEGERAVHLRDEVKIPVFSQSSVHPIMQGPYEEEHRPLARPPNLEDIIEESRSRPGSVQGIPVDHEDGFSPVKSTKKGKKGKKGKRQQPVIWEDETATPPLKPESDLGAEASIISSEGPGSSNIDAARSPELEEPVNQLSSGDRMIASPAGEFNAAFNKSEVENDRPDDYFAIRPSIPAEENVGREDTRGFRQALTTEPLYTSKDQISAPEPQANQHDQRGDDASKAHNQNEEIEPLAADFQVKPRTEAEPAEDQAEDDFDPTPIKSLEEGTKVLKKPSASESSSKALEQEDIMDQHQDFETPPADTLIERSSSRQYSLQSPSHEDELSLVAEGRSTSRGKSGSIEGVAAAVDLSVGALAAESLSRRNSKKETRHGKEAKEAGRWTDFEAKIDEPKTDIYSRDREEMAAGEQEHRQTPESESATTVWQHYQATPPRSPPSANQEAIADHPVSGNLGQPSETHEYRDSAIYVSGSPIISEEKPYHRAIRDSGYPDTETSPIIDDDSENPDVPTDLERGVAAGKRVGHRQRRHSQSHETDERQRSTSRNPLEISVETDSDYDVLVSRPKERRKRSRRSSGIAYDSDDSADSGFDVQRRRRRQAMAAEPREPSPVSSTTKDRSSALFDSSPSTREEIAAKAQHRDSYTAVREKPTWSIDGEGSPQPRSQDVLREGRSDEIPESATESIGHSIFIGHHEATGTSLFGGPQSHEDDLISPCKSPRSSEGRGRQRLKTISEDSADGSPRHRKEKRAVSDVGSPESGVKGRRMRSPPVEDDVAGKHVSTHDPTLRNPWSAAEEEKVAKEERSRSRNSDQLSNLSSRHSTLPGLTFGQREDEYRTASAGSMHSEKKSIHAIIQTPDHVRSASGLSYRSTATPIHTPTRTPITTPPLRRVDRSASGDLRGASKKDEAKSRAKDSAEFEPQPESEVDLGIIPSSSTYDPVTDKGKSRANMTDVLEGWGDMRGQSPMSPTRPPSIRKKQSMQLSEFDFRLNQLVSENRLLADQKLTAENALQEQARDHSQALHDYQDAMQEHKLYLTRKDSELSELKKIIEQLHDQAAHLTEVNEGLASSRGVDEEHKQSYNQLQADHAHIHEQWQQSTRDLENLKEQHTQLSTGMEDIVRHEVTVALEEKSIELRQLQSELENAKQQVRNLQQQLLASRNSDDFVERDEDYFDSRCQSLCQHVQQWVLRFSKFSDMKACYLAREIQDEKVVDRMENAILDGSDVDGYLSDRVKRRDVFMSVVMTMIWEFIFTRYLFGMDREQRQKLKTLEKTLQEVGPISAVHKWRATTLTLLMKREAFENQRATDTEAVVHEIYDTLATFLPPPSHLVGQIQDSLRKVVDAAVDLSIEMRTQRAEYSMLPPLQPEYDTNGDLARKVYFSALTMNERSGATSSNEALQEQQAVVRMVLFPLVVKNEDDDEPIVVCPAQVLTAEGSKGKKTVRVLSAQGGRSEASFAGSDVRMEGGMI